MTEALPLVTVLTPVYNGAAFIAETVESVLAQGYPRLQHLVLDDGSTDDTLARLEPFRGRIDLRSHANMGESRTVNRGFELAQGDLVCVVNADDPLRPGAVAAAVAAYRADGEALAFYPDWAEIDEHSRVVREVRLPDFDIARMLGSFNIGIGPGVFITRRALALVGQRNPALRYTGDLDYWFRVALRGRLVHLPEVLATHRVHAAAASASQRGEVMMREVVGLAERCCGDPLLPSELKRQASAIRSRAHFAASNHAASRAARAAYLARSFALSPTAFAGMFRRSIRRLSRRPTLLFVAMAQSIHTARWIAQIEGRGWNLHIYPSIDTGVVHPALRAMSVRYSIRDDRRGSTSGVAQRMLKLLARGYSRVARSRYLAERYSAYRARQLSRLIRKLKPDLVHSLEMQYAGYLTLDAKRLAGGAFPKWIVTNWGSDVALFGRVPEHRERIREVLSECDYYGCECERDVELARRFGLRGEVLPVIPNGGGFDLEAARRLRPAEPPSRRRVIMVKGYQTWAGRALVALHTMARCTDAVRDYEVVVHSAGEEVRLAAQLLATDTGIRVTLPPAELPHEEMLRQYGRARVAIGLSIGDGISTSLLEAMVMGAFPIQSDTACAGEWITHGKTGFIVPPEDPEAVERALRAALADDGMVDSAMEANWKVAVARLDQESVRPRVIGMYERLLRESRAPLADHESKTPGHGITQKYTE